MKSPGATFLVLVLAVGVGCSGCGTTNIAAHAPHGRADSRRATIAYVVDGDTLRVRWASGRLDYVRLVGIDTPEDVRPGTPVECGAEDAAASIRQLAPEGASVLLRGDSVAGDRDRYGRLLAHAFVGGRQLEAVQLRRGWAEVYRFEGQSFDGLPRFERAQRYARRAHLGVWSICGGDFHSAT